MRLASNKLKWHSCNSHNNRTVPEMLCGYPPKDSIGLETVYNPNLFKFLKKMIELKWYINFSKTSSKVFIGLIKQVETQLNIPKPLTDHWFSVPGMGIWMYKWVLHSTRQTLWWGAWLPRWIWRAKVYTLTYPKLCRWQYCCPE